MSWTLLPIASQSLRLTVLLIKGSSDAAKHLHERVRAIDELVKQSADLRRGETDSASLLLRGNLNISAWHMALPMRLNLELRDQIEPRGVTGTATKQQHGTPTGPAKPRCHGRQHRDPKNIMHQTSCHHKVLHHITDVNFELCTSSLAVLRAVLTGRLYSTIPILRTRTIGLTPFG